LKEHLYDQGNNPKEPIYLNDKNEEVFFVANSKYDYLRKLEKSYGKYLREILLTRLISNLEVFLINVIKEIFLQRKDLFYKGKSIEFSQNELLSTESLSQLWTKIINKECRSLQNQGFAEIKKYYLNTFGIDFNQSSISIKYLENLHEIRHLLIHRLGRVDSSYLHKYNFKGKKVTINEEEFYKALTEITEFGEFIRFQYEQIIEKKIEKQCLYGTSKAKILINLLTPKANSIVSEDFSFLSGEKFIMLKDILMQKKLSDSTIEIVLSCHRDDIFAYLKSLYRLAKNGDINIISKRVSSSPYDWFSSNEIYQVKNDIINDLITNERIEILSQQFGQTPKKIKNLINKIKQDQPHKTHGNDN
jgi:hypothetical protein